MIMYCIIYSLYRNKNFSAQQNSSSKMLQNLLYFWIKSHLDLFLFSFIVAKNERIYLIFQLYGKNFETFRLVISSSINFLFLKSECLFFSTQLNTNVSNLESFFVPLN